MPHVFSAHAHKLPGRDRLYAYIGSAMLTTMNAAQMTSAHGVHVHMYVLCRALVSQYALKNPCLQYVCTCIWPWLCSVSYLFMSEYSSTKKAVA